MNAKISDFAPESVRVIRGYVVKCWCLVYGDVGHVDDRAIAGLLAVGSVGELEGMFLDGLVNEFVQRKHRPSNMFWFVTVAMQRVRGIHPKEFAAARAELREVKALPAKLAGLKRM